MNKIFTTASIVALTTMAASSAMAATIIIDDFNTQQYVEDNPGTGEDNTSTIFAGDFLGDSRRMTVTTSPSIDDQPEGGTVFESIGISPLPTSSRLLFSNKDGQQGFAELEYIFGGGVDLTDSGTNDRFFFEVTSFDLQGAADFSATVFSTGGTGDGTGTYTETLGPGFDENLFFSDARFSNVNFASVTSILFSIQATTDSFDGSLGSISVVPLPASALLLLGGLGGLAGMSAASKRRRRKA